VANDDSSATALPSVTAPPDGTTAKPAGRRSVGQWLLATETGFSFVKGLTFISFAGTLIAAYFQYLSAYQDKVAAAAKDDLAAATATFTDTSTALSVPMSLQERIVFAFRDAVNEKVDNDDDAYVTKSARVIYANYDTAYTALRENIDLLARKTEIYIDWASDFSHDPNANDPSIADEINVALLGTSNFDCDKDMPFANGSSVLLKDKSGNPLKDKSGNQLQLDWYSAKHHVVTIGYCIDDTHMLVEPVRQWAAKSQVNAARKADLLNPQKINLIGRLSNQEARLNAFMSLTMDAIDQIRLKYQPNGFSCHVPIVREAIDQFYRHFFSPPRPGCSPFVASR
jgi:hypothetical protein